VPCSRCGSVLPSDASRALASRAPCAPAGPASLGIAQAAGGCPHPRRARASALRAALRDARRPAPARMGGRLAAGTATASPCAAAAACTSHLHHWAPPVRARAPRARTRSATRCEAHSSMAYRLRMPHSRSPAGARALSSLELSSSPSTLAATHASAAGMRRGPATCGAALSRGSPRPVTRAHGRATLRCTARAARERGCGGGAHRACPAAHSAAAAGPGGRPAAPAAAAPPLGRAGARGACRSAPGSRSARCAGSRCRCRGRRRSRLRARPHALAPIQRPGPNQRAAWARRRAPQPPHSPCSTTRMSGSPAGALQKAFRYAARGASSRTASNSSGAAARCCGGAGRGQPRARRRECAQRAARARAHLGGGAQDAPAVREQGCLGRRGRKARRQGGIAGQPREHRAEAAVVLRQDRGRERGRRGRPAQRLQVLHW